jgi:hypothetical protein
VIETTDCRMAAKTGKFKINGKEHPFEMNFSMTVIVNLVGGLDKGNCEVGLYEVKGVPLRSQVVVGL